MTRDQLRKIINEYKRRAADGHRCGIDLYERNRLIKVVHELEDNFDFYLDFEEDPEELDCFLDIYIEKEKPRYRWGHLSNPPEEDLDFDDEIDLWDWDSIEEEKEYYIDDEGNEYNKEDEDSEDEDL
ncbi:MAG: hypothetical protein IKO62_07360 [Bacteroidales bacterium]|nr:hypothetical protein [Bacteroidales bacterium]